jgi:hypothetical protein
VSCHRAGTDEPALLVLRRLYERIRSEDRELFSAIDAALAPA